MRRFHSLQVVFVALGLLAGAPCSFGASETLVATQTATGYALVTLTGTTNCAGDYTVPISNYSIAGTTLTVQSTIGTPCRLSSTLAPYSASVLLPASDDGVYSIVWNFNRLVAEPGSPTPSGTFTGTITVPAGAFSRGVVIAPPAITFPAQAVGTRSSVTTITVTNPDSVPHVLYIYRTSNSCPAFGPCNIPPGWYTDFPFDTDCIQSLAPQASCTINVTFASRGAGTRSSAITVYPQFIFGIPAVQLEGNAVALAAEQVPTLSEWGTIVLVLALALLGIGALAKRYPMAISEK